MGRFLQIDLLLQADPFEQAEAVRLAGGRFEAQENPTVRELLDRAAAGLAGDRIEAKFPKQPRVQAEILRTIGSAYLGVGEYEKAAAHLARADWPPGCRRAGGRHTPAEPRGGPRGAVSRSA